MAPHQLSTFSVFVDGDYGEDVMKAAYNSDAVNYNEDDGAWGEMDYQGQARELHLTPSPNNYSRAPNWRAVMAAIGKTAGSIVFVRPGDYPTNPEPYFNQIIRVYGKDEKKKRPITVVMVTNDALGDKVEELRRKSKEAVENLECKIGFCSQESLCPH